MRRDDRRRRRWSRLKRDRRRDRSRSRQRSWRCHGRRHRGRNRRGGCRHGAGDGWRRWRQRSNRWLRRGPREGAPWSCVPEGGPAELAELRAGFAGAPAARADASAILRNGAGALWGADVDYACGSDGACGSGGNELWRGRRRRVLETRGGGVRLVAAADAVARAGLVRYAAPGTTSRGERLVRSGLFALGPECGRFAGRPRSPRRVGDSRGSSGGRFSRKR